MRSYRIKMKLSAISGFVVLAVFVAVSQAEVQPNAKLHRLYGNSRIVNGQDAEPNTYPYQVSLWWGWSIIIRPSHVCGGSLISESWVVTAAHCFTELPNFGSHTVYAGKHRIDQTEATQQSSSVALRIIHPSYAGGVAPHDIALIKLSNPFTLNDVVAPIALPAQNTVHTGNVVLTGWGSTSTTILPSLPVILQTVTIPVVDTVTCYNALANIVANPPLDTNTLDNVCSGPLDESRISACSGDSGGPLAQQVGKSWELVGIVSWGISPCGSVGAPSVYVRASAYVDWINEQIAAN